jgi:hypothetical protein
LLIYKHGALDLLSPVVFSQMLLTDGSIIISA